MEQIGWQVFGYEVQTRSCGMSLRGEKRRSNLSIQRIGDCFALLAMTDSDISPNV
jgi:hypothetical protein